jgi:Holliday junction DNA helicase RuvA
MIATLSGNITDKWNDQVVLECGGVGYGLFVTLEDFGVLETGNKTKLYVYEHIRENAHDLFRL